MDTQIPAWHTTVMTMSRKQDELRAALDEARARAEQAERAQEDAETAQRRAEEKAQREADRADGAESLARDLLAQLTVHTAEHAGLDPDRLDDTALDRIADVLADDWAHGTPVEELRVIDRITEWETSR